MGNPLGKPYDRNMQPQTLELALQLAVTAKSPQSIETDFRFSSDDAWKINYGRVTDSNRAALIRLGEHNRAQRRAERQQGLFRRRK